MVGPLEFNVFVILEDTNMERLKKFDPAQLGIEKMGPPWTSLKLNTVLIGYCPAEEMPHVDALFQQRKAQEALQFLSRGFEFRQDLGDNDGQYQRESKP